MKRVLVEKLAVTAMFLLVIVVFSFASHDTRKIIELHSRSAQQISPQPAYTAATATGEQPPFPVATRN